jgi:hypothetical protein
LVFFNKQLNKKYHIKRNAFVVLILMLSVSCATKILTYDKTQELQKNHEFEEAVKIVETPVVNESIVPAATTTADKNKNLITSAGQSATVKQDKNKSKEAKKIKPTVKKTAKTVTNSDSKSATNSTAANEEVIIRRPPDVESDLGFSGGFQNRRPAKDPFHVGERVQHEVSYFAMKAGTLEFMTRPFAQVNGLQNYQFRMAIKTGSFFASVYSVDDYVDVLMDFEKMIPSVFALHVRETSLLRESRMLFDHNLKKATFWDKKVTAKDGEENIKKEWEISDYAQNVYSTVFYLRTFHWDVGVTNSFQVSNNGENLLFKGTAIRKEKLETAVGTFNTIVIRPELELKGKFQPIGENLIWLSDDDRKFILRVEAKIKIGTLVSQVIELNPGNP